MSFLLSVLFSFSVPKIFSPQVELISYFSCHFVARLMIVSLIILVYFGSVSVFMTIQYKVLGVSTEYPTTSHAA